jgi:hypothetical protein
VKNPQKKGDGRRRAEPAKGRKPGTPKSGPDSEKTPEWTQSLRQLYDSVVDEPLPESFKNLLEKLDKHP